MLGPYASLSNTNLSNIRPTVMAAPARHAHLRRAKAQGDTGISFYGSFLHPNPAFYKYYFYLFTEESVHEGKDFFCPENRLCIAEYERRSQEIRDAGDLAYAYNSRHPRRGEATPFDPSHPKWADAEWAPPLSEDPDPAVEGGYR